MFCENCGSKIDVDAKFCDSCGAAVDGESTVAPAVPVQAPPPATPVYYENAVTPRKKKPVGKIIGFSALGLILIIGIAIGVTILKVTYDSKPSTTIAKVIQSGELPEDISSIDLTGRWYMLLSYYTVYKDGEPGYIFYKLQLDVKRNSYGSNDVEVTTLDASYFNEHEDYPGDGVEPPKLSGKATIGGSGKSMYFILRDKNNPYPHAMDFWEWEIMDGKYIQSMLFPLEDQQRDGELYPFGYLRSEDSEDFIWKLKP